MSTSLLNDSPSVLYALGGSRAAGFATTDSDFDTLRVVVVPSEAFLGVYTPRPGDLQNVRRSKRPEDETLTEEQTIQDVSVFARRMLRADQKTLDALYGTDTEHHPLAGAFIDLRDSLLSKELCVRYAGIIGDIERTARKEGPTYPVRRIRLARHLVEQMRALWRGDGYVVRHDGDLREEIQDYADNYFAHAARRLSLTDMMLDIQSEKTTHLPDEPDRPALVKAMNSVIMDLRNSSLS